ncbi:MAG: hypothetical protein K1W19_10665 [Lachnospiraceae bacterium]|jgi:hypothetical protein|nr:hypothetical protein [Lachnospiraceae bacterium]MCI8826328.1 hypothetical protein [Lachnospiraceae bacterium]MCI9370773.1 hypothetical protein [Lachnospiraceae bacterium]
MNLKESYRYANYLDSLLNRAYMYLGNKGFVTTTKQNHLRSKANKEAEDEIMNVQKPFDVDFTPNNIIDFVVKVLTEKEALSNAIAAAKASTEINIDNAVAMNKKKQGFVYILNGIVNLKPTEKTVAGRAYKFDINNEQKPYVYDITETTTIDFDRNDVKALIRKYNKECDEISSKLDAIEINTEVAFVPRWDVNDVFEDIVME